MEMLGLRDAWVLCAYLLCLASTLLCAVYGLVAWNRGDDSVRKEDAQWAAEEKRIERQI
jgi:hypothetical protein